MQNSIVCNNDTPTTCLSSDHSASIEIQLLRPICFSFRTICFTFHITVYFFHFIFDVLKMMRWNKFRQVTSRVDNSWYTMYSTKGLIILISIWYPWYRTVAFGRKIVVFSDFFSRKFARYPFNILLISSWYLWYPDIRWTDYQHGVIPWVTLQWPSARIVKEGQDIYRDKMR